MAAQTYCCFGLEPPGGASSQGFRRLAPAAGSLRKTLGSTIPIIGICCLVVNCPYSSDFADKCQRKMMNLDKNEKTILKL